MEVVDLVLRLREKLVSVVCIDIDNSLILYWFFLTSVFVQIAAASQQIPVDTEVVDKLQSHMDAIIATLPEDLQSVLKSN